MQNNSKSIIFPQIFTSAYAIIAIIDLFFVLSFYPKYIITEISIYIPPILSISIAISVILGIKKKNFGIYNSAQKLSLVISILQTIVIALYMIVAIFTDIFKRYFQMYDIDYDFAIKFFVILFIINLLISWLRSYVLICYKQRVRDHCENITLNDINNEVGEAFV